MNNTEKKDTYTMSELADILGINFRTAYRYCKKGEIPAKKVLGRWIIPKPAVDRFLKGDFFGNAKD